MKKLTLTVSASLLAVAGCGGSEPVHTNSGPAPDPPTINALPTPSGTAAPTVAPSTPSSPVLKTPAELNALPSAQTADPLPAPSTKPGAPPMPPPIHTNTMPK